MQVPKDNLLTEVATGTRGSKLHSLDAVVLIAGNLSRVEHPCFAMATIADAGEECTVMVVSGNSNNNSISGMSSTSIRSSDRQ